MNNKTNNTGIFAIRCRVWFVAILYALLSTLLPSRASAYKTRLSDDCSVALHWPVEQEIPFWLNQNGCGDLPFEACESAVMAAFDTVQNIDCTGIRFKYMGPTATDVYRHNPPDTVDGVNLIIWYESWPPESGISDVAVASTWSLRNHLGEFVEFGIALNGDTYQWANDLSSNAHDVQATITAQILYVLGLTQSDSDASILDGLYAYGSDRKRTPLQDDVEGVCYLAPLDPEPDHWDVGCPSDQHCEASKCVPGAPPIVDAGTTGTPNTDSSTTTASNEGGTSSRDAAVVPTGDAAAQKDARSSPYVSPENTNDDTTASTDSSGERQAECQFNSDCVDDRVCTNGKCVDSEKGDDSCGCRIGRARPTATPIITLLFFVLCTRILRKRISRL